MQLEVPFYTPRIQFWRAQAGIAGVTALLFLVGMYGSIGTLWVLYLAALLLVSRYGERQFTYVAVALEVAALAAGAHLWELTRTSNDLTTLRIVGDVGVRAFGILLPSFLIHYLARVDITSKRGAAVRDQVVQMLLERAMFENDSRVLWWAVREACAVAVNAAESQIYRYDQERDQF
jgi:hypothetical protein